LTVAWNSAATCSRAKQAFSKLTRATLIRLKWRC
jgi:hypothetical protein